MLAIIAILVVLAGSTIYQTEREQRSPYRMTWRQRRAWRRQRAVIAIPNRWRS